MTSMVVADVRAELSTTRGCCAALQLFSVKLESHEHSRVCSSDVVLHEGLWCCNPSLGMFSPRLCVAAAFLLLFLSSCTEAVDRGKFKTCAQVPLSLRLD